jgi:hypothetical protein
VIQVKKVEKTVVSKENVVRQRVLHAGFFEELHEQVDILRESLATVVGCGEIIIKQAATQADSVICWRSINNMSDAAIANDSDFPVVAGVKMMLIRNWNGAILGKRPTLTNLELATSSLAPLKQAIVGDLRLDEQTIKVAKYPLLETDDPILRGFIAVGSGCDALPGGVPGVGPGIIQKQLDTSCTVSHLRGFYAKRTKKPEIFFDALVASLLHEPGNTSDDSGPFKYCIAPPPSLPNYLKAFSMPGAPIDLTLELETCCGPTGNEHLFLKVEGETKCKECNTTICPLCIANLGAHVWVAEGDYCLQCFALSVVGASPDDAAEDGATQEKRKRLREEHNVSDAAELSMVEVEELFEALVIQKELERGDADCIQYPLYATNALNDNRCIRFDFIDGAQFLQSDKLICISSFCGVELFPRRQLPHLRMK